VERERVAFVVYVDLDPVPGTFHSKESAQNVLGRILGRILNRSCPHYNPMVSLAPAELQPKKEN
jgi:hypothetical protein